MVSGISSSAICVVVGTQTISGSRFIGGRPGHVVQVVESVVMVKRKYGRGLGLGIRNCQSA